MIFDLIPFVVGVSALYILVAEAFKLLLKKAFGGKLEKLKSSFNSDLKEIKEKKSRILSDPNKIIAIEKKAIILFIPTILIGFIFFAFLSFFFKTTEEVLLFIIFTQIFVLAVDFAKEKLGKSAKSSS